MSEASLREARFALLRCMPPCTQSCLVLRRSTSATPARSLCEELLEHIRSEMPSYHPFKALFNSASPDDRVAFAYILLQRQIVPLMRWTWPPATKSAGREGVSSTQSLCVPIPNEPSASPRAHTGTEGEQSSVPSIGGAILLDNTLAITEDVGAARRHRGDEGDSPFVRCAPARQEAAVQLPTFPDLPWQWAFPYTCLLGYHMNSRDCARASEHTPALSFCSPS